MMQKDRLLALKAVSILNEQEIGCQFMVWNETVNLHECCERRALQQINRRLMAVKLMLFYEVFSRNKPWNFSTIFRRDSSLIVTFSLS
jgi:hypothetical protein